MQRILFFIFISLLSFQAESQIIDNRTGNVFKEEMYFNQQFLWQNKVKTITGTTSIKRTNRPIEQRPDLIVYRFNEVGLLQKLDKVSSVLNFVDSLTIEYQRSQTGAVEVKKENNPQGYFTTNYNYDGDGHLVRMDFGKAENISPEKGKLQPGQTITINSETFKWVELKKGTWMRSNYNNYGLHYSNVTIVRNELGYLISEEEALIMSGRITTKTYAYDEHGWISSITVKDNSTGAEKKEVFAYDKLGNLTKAEYYEGNKRTREVEILYTSTMLVEAFLDHDLQNNDIVITKFTYEYF